jgi:Replication protein
MSLERSQIKAFRQSQKLADRLRELGNAGKAGEVGACGKFWTFYVCHECGQFCYLAKFRCGHRLCAQCGRKRVYRLLESLGGVLNEIKNPKLLTVSLRSRPCGELADSLRELWAAFARLRHRAIWKKVNGSIVSLEITYNPGSLSFHPHLHILLDADYIPWVALHAAWVQVSHGCGNAVYIQKCRTGWQRELIKYVTKVADLLQDLEALREFLRATKGKRFIRTYGTLYNAGAEREDVSEVPVCSGCGAPMHLEQECVSITLLGVNRLDRVKVGECEYGNQFHGPP